MIDCNKKEDHKKCRQAHVDECLGKDLNKMCEARKALETRWADDVRPPIGTFSDQIDWAIGEIRRLRAENERMREALSSPELLETLAALEHERWSGWMKYQAEKAGGEHPITGEPYEIRWKRQSETPYARLPEQERESDRIEVRKTLSAIRAALSRAEQAKPETCVWEDRGMEGWWPRCCDEGDGGCSKWEYPEAPNTCPGCGKRIEVRR